ncbi:hypothetical protein I4U23_012352 [Adineta vaga]|nr:hypothetical protein I4U23_012352 [Adineta vaga]
MFGRKLQDDKDQDTNDLLSKMFYRQECISSQTGESFIVADVSHLIEPLVGLLRDPLSVCSQPDSSLLSLSLYKGAIIQSKRFLLLSVSAPIYVHFLMEDHESTLQNSISSGKGEANILPWMYKRSKSSLFDTSIDMASAKSILIDLGSSYFGAWNNDTSAAAGRWFYEYYKRFGVKFDRVIAFEQSTLDPKVAWQQLPDDVFPIYTLINVGCSATGQFNPWRTLKAIARPHDNTTWNTDALMAVDLALRISLISIMADQGS